MDDSDALTAALDAVLADPAAARAMAAAGRAAFEARHAQAPVLAAWRAGLARIAGEPG